MFPLRTQLASGLTRKQESGCCQSDSPRGCLGVTNARYHHAKLVQAWLAQPGRRVKVHFIPAYCPHLDPAERLWGLMHKHVTHNRCHATFADFKAAILTFLREEVPRKWGVYCDQVTDNFRIISPGKFRLLH